MNWGRAKTILIFMFFITDLFLFVILVQTKTSVSQISAETIGQTVSILNNNGITVSPKMIPDKRIQNQNILMENFFADPQKAAEKLLGENVKPSNETTEAYPFVYENELGSLTVDREGFLYLNKKIPTPYTEVKKMDQISAQVIEGLARKGITKNTFVIVETKSHDGFYTCCVVPVYDKKQISGVSMDITVDKEDIIKMTGNWFFGTNVAKDEGSLLDVTAVLAEMIYRPEKEPLTISNISSGYYVADAYLSSREISAVPIYIIEADNGTVYTYDARVGGRIE